MLSADNALLVTGGAGFIGSNFVLSLMENSDFRVVNVDKLTYAGNLMNLASLEKNPRHVFVKADIGDAEVMRRLLREHRPAGVVNFAAESHVDRSIHAPMDFIHTNVTCTFRLLDEVRAYWTALPDTEKHRFRFLHVSTDEVYGTLNSDDRAFTETTPYAPNSPYAASKAASDHLVRAYHHTYGLPTLISNCSNNYGPLQFPEKLIPLMILNAVRGKPLPLYGDGLNVRDWLYVSDHCEAIRLLLERGRVGESYNIGGNAEKTNVEVVRAICEIMDQLRSKAVHVPHASLITYIKDRPGHDRRYAIDSSKIRRELGWSPQTTFAKGLLHTVRWYLDNSAWVENVTSGAYRKWITDHYGDRMAV